MKVRTQEKQARKLASFVAEVGGETRDSETGNQLAEQEGSARYRSEFAKVIASAAKPAAPKAPVVRSITTRELRGLTRGQAIDFFRGLIQLYGPNGDTVLNRQDVKMALKLWKARPDIHDTYSVVDLIKAVAFGRVPQSEVKDVLGAAMSDWPTQRRFFQLPPERKEGLMSYFSLWATNAADRVPFETDARTGLSLRQRSVKVGELRGAMPDLILNAVRQHSHLLNFAGSQPWMSASVTGLALRGDDLAFRVTIHDGPGAQENFTIQGDGKVLSASLSSLRGVDGPVDLTQPHDNLPAPRTAAVY